MTGLNAYFNPEPYIPGSPSEVNDVLGSMILWAPAFVDDLGDFPDRNIDSEFHRLTAGLGVVRKKLGEERYAALLDLAARAKTLFAADQDDTNGKTDEGRVLLFEMEYVLKNERNPRAQAEMKEDEDEVTGD